MDLEKIDTEHHFTTKEKNLHGDCFVRYTYEDNEEFADFKVIHKSVAHLKDCVNRRYRHHDNLNGKACNADPKMEEKFRKVLQNPENAQDYASAMIQSYTPTEPLFSEATTSFFLYPVNGDIYKIERMFSFGNVIVQPFSEEGATFTTVSNSTMILKEIHAITADIEVTGDLHENVEFQFEDGEWAWNNPLDLKEREHLYSIGYYLDETQDTLKDTLEKGIENFVTEMIKYKTQHYTQDEINRMHTAGIQRLFTVMIPLNYDSLVALKDKYFKETSEKGIFERNVFTELLPMAGTNPAAVLIFDMLKNKEFETDADAARILTSVPFHIRKPTQTLVQYYDPLLNMADSMETFTKMAIPLTFAHLVRRTCELTTPHPYQAVENTNNKYSQMKRECEEQLINPYVDMFFEKFQSTKDEGLENHYLQVLNNLRWGKVYDVLKPVVQGQDEHKKEYNIRSTAIFAIAHAALERGLEKEVFLPILFDRYDNHEVRIAAFDILMKGAADATTLSQIMKHMVYEKDNEVFNYVYSAFEKFAENDFDECNYNLREFADYFLKYWEQHMWMRPSYAVFVSKTYGKVFHKDKYGYGGSFNIHTIGSHKSFSPLAMYFDVQSIQYEHHQMQVFGGYIRIQGLAKKLMDKIRSMTFFNPEQWKVDDLKDILFSKMNIRERASEPVEVDLVFSVKDNVVFQRHYNEDSVAPGGKLYNFFMDIVALGQEYKINHQRGLRMSSIVYEQPTEYGVPMTYIAGVTTLASVQAEVSRPPQGSGFVIRKIDYKIQLHTQVVNTMSTYNLATKSVFAISQDRVYNQKYGSKITAVVTTFPKPQIKVTMERPDFGEPISMVMHSRVYVSTRGNKLFTRDTELQKSCPTCEPEYVITKGGDHKVDRNFIDIDNEEWGFHAEGKYFDCEAHAASSKGQMLNEIVQAFSPLGKHPKDLLTTVIMGLRQINAFTLYFPHIESCGLGFQWSQSKFNPVDTIEMTFTGQMKTLEKADNLMQYRKFAVDGEIVFHGAVDRVFHVSMKYDMEPLGSKNEVAIKLSRSPFRLNAREYPTYSVCLDYRSLYPYDGKNFLKFDMTTDQKVKEDLTFSWGPHSSCNNNPGKVQIVGEHETTVEGRQHLKNTWYYKACMQQRESPEWKGSSVPVTDACYYTFVDLYTLRHYRWVAQVQNLEEWMENAYYKFETLVKTGLFPFWRLEHPTHNKDTDFIYATNSHSDSSSFFPHIILVDTVFHPEEDSFDMVIQTPREKNFFEGINYGLWAWNDEPYLQMAAASSSVTELRNSHLPFLSSALVANNVIGTCAASTRSIRTFDNVTYPYEMHNCWTLVSSHCAPNPTYAVFMKKSPKFANDIVPKMDVKIYVGGISVTIKPVTHAKYEVTIDDQVVSLDEHETYFYPTNQKLSGRNQEAPENYKFKVYR